MSSLRAGGGRSRRRFVVLAAFLVCLLFAASSATPASFAAPDEGDDVLRFAETTQRVDSEDLSPIVRDTVAGAIRSRFVELSVGQLANHVESLPVKVELFPDVVAEFDTAGEAGRGADGSLTWSATGPDAAVTFTFGETEVRGVVDAGGKSYVISPVGNGVHAISERTPEWEPDVVLTPPPSRAPLAPEGTLSAELPEMKAAAAAGPAVISVLTVFDDDAAAFLDDGNSSNGNANADSRREIAAWIDFANAAYARSGVNTRLKSVAIDRVPNTPGNSPDTELYALSGRDDGFLDDVHGRRNAVGADLVVLIVGDIVGLCGIAYLLDWPPSPRSARFGFSVVETCYGYALFVYAHEVGHNLGGHHGSGETGVFPYANAYLNRELNYHTIMSPATRCYSCEWLPYFSTPDVLHEGRPIGSPTQDNARVFNETSAAVANFRPPRPPLPRVYCEGKRATLAGTNEADVLRGTPGPDVIVAKGGDDTIRGLAGDDIICAGEGDDIVYSGRGSDLVSGQAGRDVLRGSGGNDELVGGRGGDDLRGGDGRDDLRGGAGNDELRGQQGRDRLDGGTGLDFCALGSGSDTRLRCEKP